MWEAFLDSEPMTMSSLLRTRTVSRSIKSAWLMVAPSHFLVGVEGEDCLLPMLLIRVEALQMSSIATAAFDEHELCSSSSREGEKCKKEKERRSVAEIRVVVIGTPWSLVVDTANYDISRLSKCPIRQMTVETAYRMPRRADKRKCRIRV